MSHDPIVRRLSLMFLAVVLAVTSSIAKPSEYFAIVNGRSTIRHDRGARQFGH